MVAGRFLTILLALVELASAPDAQAADQPLVFKPASKWTADFATENCALRRGFENEGKAIILEFNSFTYGDSFQVKVYSSDLKVTNRTPQTRFEPDKVFDKQGNSIGVKFVDGKDGLLYRDTVFKNGETPSKLDHATRDRRESEITGLFIKDGFHKDILLQTGSLHAPMEVLRRCLADLAATEGLDPQKIATLSRNVEPKDQESWQRMIMLDYPSKMVREGRSASIDIRLIVDEQGKPISCKTRDNGQDPTFTTTACDDVMKYARFEPALDAEGKPAKAYWTTSIIYAL